MEEPPWEVRTYTEACTPGGGGGGDPSHDHLADQPEWELLPSVVNRTRMYRPVDVLVEGVDEPLNRPSCVDDVVSPSYSVTKSKLLSVLNDEKESCTFCPLGQRSFQAQSLLLA